MKLQRRMKGVEDVKRNHQYPTHPSQWSPSAIQLRNLRRVARESNMTPLEARAAGKAYYGPIMPDKGKKNGSCNRTACQVPLTGQPQFWMQDYTITNGRLYYCARCEIEFSKWDRIDRPGAPLRCTPDEDNRIRVIPT